MMQEAEMLLRFTLTRHPDWHIVTRYDAVRGRWIAKIVDGGGKTLVISRERELADALTELASLLSLATVQVQP